MLDNKTEWLGPCDPASMKRKVHPQIASRIFIRITRHTGINAAASDTTSRIEAMRAVYEGWVRR